MSDHLQELSEAGVSIWLDDLSRERIDTGNLAELVKNDHVVGVTTNPSIFASALADGERYDDQVRELADQGADVDKTVFALTTTDVRNACDVLRPVWEETGGVDGRVSIEVAPDLAHDTDQTLGSAKVLWAAVDRPNLLIKIPATTEGAPAITSTLAEGISVNVTLIFGLERYQGVMEAFVRGLEQARANGHDISQIHSVASFFVSRVDTEIDRRLDEIGTPEATALKSKAALANARLAYQAYQEVFEVGSRFQQLVAAGVAPQRPLWASTGVKDPELPDTLYVTELVAPDTVNTMPEATIEAFKDHGTVARTADADYAGAQRDLDGLTRVGVDFADVGRVLEDEGVASFAKSFDELIQALTDKANKLTEGKPERGDA